MPWLLIREHALKNKRQKNGCLLYTIICLSKLKLFFFPFMSLTSSLMLLYEQGIIDPAFSKPRTPIAPCFCLQVPASHQQQSSSPLSNGIPPLHAKSGRGKCTTAPMLLDLIKEVENAISHRKGRTGTAAGDVAFPKGKENLASVLKRYKRRLSNKPVGAHEGTCSRKIPTSASYVS